MTTEIYTNRPAAGIALVIIGIIAISINDMLVKWLSADYPLHEIIAIRSFIGLALILAFLRFDGGLTSLRTRTPVIHILRGLCIVMANLSFYAAVAVMPLAQVTALFFVAPLFITILSVFLLKEAVSAASIVAVCVGFLGVMVMQRPWGSGGSDTPTLVFFLPIMAAFLYALTQTLTRKLGLTTRASAMAVYTQSIFLIICASMFLVAGDGRFAANTTNESLLFIVKPWIVPPAEDLLILALLGVLSAVTVFTLTQSYRLAKAAIIAPFEYIGMPLAILLGWLVFGEWPTIEVWIGCALIIGAGLYVLAHQKAKPRPRPKVST